MEASYGRAGVVVLELQDVTKRYGSKVAVDALSFSARPGAVTGFLGPNGAGKSTSLRVLLGLDEPDAGLALVEGRPYRTLRAPLHTVGSLLDARGVVPRRGARPHLLALAHSNGIAARRVDEVLELCGLAEVAERPAGQFSLGMGQRLGIAGALLGDPPVLVLDEPVNGLDPEGIIWIRTLLRSLAEEGRTVLLSSHLMAEMALTAQDLVVIGRGALIAQTTVAEVVRAAGGDRVRVRTPDAERFLPVLQAAGSAVTADRADDTLLQVNGADTDAVGRLAAAHAVTLLELAAQPASLEDAYLQMTARAVEHRGQERGTGTPTGEQVAA